MRAWTNDEAEGLGLGGKRKGKGRGEGDREGQCGVRRLLNVSAVNVDLQLEPDTRRVS